MSKGHELPDFDDWPPPLNDREAWGKIIAMVRAVERLKNIGRVAGEILETGSIGLNPKPARWTGVGRDACQWIAVHCSSLSEVEIDLMRGTVEIEINGKLIGQIAGSVRASGIVRVHFLQDGSGIRYRTLE